jgi:hypothetical protein
MASRPIDIRLSLAEDGRVRDRLTRHLDAARFAVAQQPAEARASIFLTASRAATAPPPPPPEFNWRDRAAMLLHVGAEIEHALMVQYLFAAYSLGGPQVPPALQPQVRAWQETILGIAKEEMGHLVTVQNILTAIGAPLNLDREDLPWGTPFYPFAFTLEPLSERSLAKYVVAESPQTGWEGEEADRIRALADQGGEPVVPVGILYGEIGALLGDEGRIDEADFQAQTLPYQASWDEWGRGYRGGKRGLPPELSNVTGVPGPDVLVLTAYSRASAVEALHEVGEQGESLDEAPDLDDETSHFRRFLTIFQQYEALSDDERRQVVRPLQENPRADRFASEEATLWGHLFNLRYRMLLVNLAHAFELAGPATESPRGLTIHRTFREMYNLRTIAGFLVALPATEAADGPRAAPPFEMPYTLDLPSHERDRLRLQRDLIDAARPLLAGLEAVTGERGQRYVAALREADEIASGAYDGMIGDRA